jgi:DNA-binding response OmpR family regulator
MTTTPLKLLIAEDDAKIRDILKTYASTYGYSIQEAKDGQEALRLFATEEFDAIILDVMMPKIDGWTVLKEVRATSRVPVILLTARGEEYDKLFGFELGVDDYIVKPFSPKELMARLKAVLKRHHVGHDLDQTLYTFEKLMLNTVARSVTIADNALKMTPKEFDLLLYLMRNERKVLTRQQILDSVWGLDFYGDDRTVDTHIKMLRESIKPYKHWVSTVWGVGYKFDSTLKAKEV